MKFDQNGKPKVGQKGYMLGVRPTDPHNTDPRRRYDVAAVNDAQLVQAGEGLSASVDPSVLKVRKGEALFEIDSADLSPFLHDNLDHPPHCFIEPVVPLPL